MPQGIGTYGSDVGRPAKKKKRKALQDGTAEDLAGKKIENPYQKEHKQKTQISRMLKGCR